MTRWSSSAGHQRARLIRRSNPLPLSYFGHIFDGGYSAGYYFYTWAEVLDRMRSRRSASGDLFNKKIAADFRTKILARGRRLATLPGLHGADPRQASRCSAARHEPDPQPDEGPDPLEPESDVVTNRENVNICSNMKKHLSL